MPKLLKLFLPAFLLILCFKTNVKAQINQQRKALFDDNWRFFRGNPTNASANNFDDKSWRLLDLPHDWSIEGKINPKNPMAGEGGFFPSGIGWYRKTFNAPSAWKGKRISIYFEGVYMNSEVFVNGKSLGLHPYGYTTFSYDITTELNFNGENVIAVKVDNSKQKNSRFYSGSGIYRHVWIIATDPVHIANWGTAVTTPQVSAKQAIVQIKTKITNETAQDQQVTVETEIKNNNVKIVGANQTKLVLPAKTEKEIVQNVTVFNPQFWSPNSPQLYQAEVHLSKNKHDIDSNKIDFGIRSIQFSTQNGFQLNGKTLKLNGGCVHHDNGCLGAVAFNRAEERRVELLKAAGFNAIRTSHNPPSEAFLDACDKLGLLVIDEAFDGWRTAKNQYDYAMNFDEWSQRDMESMVLRDRNHPSIIMWSTGNEILERKEPQAITTSKTLASYVRNIDATRPVTSAMTTWDKEWEMFDPMMAAHDVAGYNYQLFRAAADHQRIPSRVIVQTESYPKDAFANWKLVTDNSYILGDFVWTAMDYLGESGIGRWYYSGESSANHGSAELFPWHGAYCGDIDLTGWRKPISHYRSMLYNDAEKLYLAVQQPETKPLEIKVTDWAVWPTWESWTWPGFEGKTLKVEVYAKYPAVRLYLNQKLIAEKPTTQQQEFKAEFELPYISGELKAVGVQNGKEMETKILRTAGNAEKIEAHADRSVIAANGQDLSYISINLTDKNSILTPNAENKLHFNIDGPGTISGVDNANLKDTDPYQSDSRAAWHGRALVVIRSTKKSGTIKLTIHADGLADAVVKLKSN